MNQAIREDMNDAFASGLRMVSSTLCIVDFTMNFVSLSLRL